MIMCVHDAPLKLQFSLIKLALLVREIVILTKPSKNVNNVLLSKFITQIQRSVNVHMKKNISQVNNVLNATILNSLILRI